MTILNNFLPVSDGPKLISNVLLANQTSDTTRSLSISSHQIGDMIFVMTGNRTTTAPTLLSGYTNITSIANAQSRSIRLQYKFATNATESISWTGAYGYMLAIRNASAILQSPISNVNEAVSNITIPNTSTLNTAGKSLIIVGTYLTSIMTAVSSPYTLYVNTLGYLEKNSNSSSISKTITTNAAANIGYLVEVI